MHILFHFFNQGLVGHKRTIHSKILSMYALGVLFADIDQLNIVSR